MLGLTRVVFTGDVLRTDNEGSPLQLGNVRWLYSHFGPTISEITGLPTSIRYRHNEEDNGRSVVQKWYGLMGHPSGEWAWAATFWTSDPPPALVSELAEDYDCALVICVEMSPILEAVLNRLGVPWIDINISPLRFLEDLLVCFRCSGHFSAIPSHDGFLQQSHINYAVQRVREYYAGRIRQGEFDGSAIYFAQTPTDRTLIKDCGFISDEEVVENIAASSKGCRLFVKPHPFSASNSIISACQKILGAEITDVNTYALLSSSEKFKALTISSSVAVEAAAFEKRSFSFHDKVQRWIYDGPASLHAHRSPAFWRELLAGLMPTRDIRREDIQMQPNMLRRELGFFGLDQDVWT